MNDAPHAKPIAKLIPIENIHIDFFGCLKNTVMIMKDIISPIDVAWEANEGAKFY